MKQPVFYLKRDVILEEINNEELISLGGYAWGESSPDELRKVIHNLHFESNDMIKATKVFNEILNVATAKMPGGANSSLERIVRKLKKHRISI